MLPSTVTNFACFSDSHLKCIIGNETISTQTVDMFILSFNYWTNILWALVTDRLWRRVVNRVEVALARTELKDGQNWKSLHQNQLEHPESLPAIFVIQYGRPRRQGNKTLPAPICRQSYSLPPYPDFSLFYYSDLPTGP